MRYSRHKIYQDRFNKILYVLSFKFLIKWKKFDRIRKKFQQEKEKRENQTSEIKDIKTEKVVLYDIIAIEDRYQLFKRIKTKQTKKDIFTFRLKDIEKRLQDMNYKSIWAWYRIDIDENTYISIMKYHEEYLIVSMIISLEWNKKDLINNATVEYINTPYMWIFEWKRIFEYIKLWIGLSRENRINDLWEKIENSIIWYINQYQSILWWIFYEEHIYPPVELVFSINWFNYTKHKDLLMLWKSYDLFWPLLYHNDTLEKWYLIGIKENSNKENYYLKYLANLINNNTSKKEMYWWSIVNQIFLENKEESLYLDYLFITNYFIEFLQEKINLIYSKTVLLWKNNKINIWSVIELKNELNWYIVLFQRIEKDDLKQFFEIWMKMHEDLLSSIKQKQIDINKKIILVNDIIKTNLEYKIIQTNNNIQRTSIFVAIISFIVGVCSLIVAYNSLSIQKESSKNPPNNMEDHNR